MNIESALARFLTQVRADGRSPHTVAQLSRHIRCFARWCVDVGQSRALKRVDPECIAGFLTSLKATLRPDGTRKKFGSMNALRCSIRSFFSFCRGAGYVRDNPARLVRYARCAPPSPRGLADVEERRLLSLLSKGETAEDRRDHLIAHLMVCTGLRLGSALGLDTSDVDLDGRTIAVRTVKGGGTQTIYLNRAITIHLRRYLRQHPEGPLFTAHGRRVSSRHVQRRVSQWMQKAGITGASVHSLRHSFAMKLYGKTGDVLLVKEALGHRAISSTLRYARADEKRLRRAMG